MTIEEETDRGRRETEGEETDRGGGDRLRGGGEDLIVDIQWLFGPYIDL